MKTILLTGFEPFGGEAVNPALEAVRRIPDDIGGVRIVKLPVPVVYVQAADCVIDAIRRHQPFAVLSVGQAAGRSAVSLERVAINVDDAAAPDNAGDIRTDLPIAPDGPAAYFATLPNRQLIAAVQAAGIDCRLSNSAGTYVCNHLLYSVLHHAALHQPDMTAGFMHVPLIPEQAEGKPNMPSVPLETIVSAIEACLRSLSAG